MHACGLTDVSIRMRTFLNASVCMHFYPSPDIFLLSIRQQHSLCCYGKAVFLPIIKVDTVRQNITFRQFRAVHGCDNHF